MKIDNDTLLKMMKDATELSDRGNRGIARRIRAAVAFIRACERGPDGAYVPNPPPVRIVTTTISQTETKPRFGAKGEVP